MPSQLELLLEPAVLCFQVLVTGFKMPHPGLKLAILVDCRRFHSNIYYIYYMLA
jgi:hypothetical protein